MNIIAIVVTALFTAKILWNLLVPYVLAVRALRTREHPRRGISLAPIVELVLLGVAVIWSLLAESSWPWDTHWIALIGGAVIAGSYVHLFIVGMIGGWVARRAGPASTDR